MLKLYTRLLAAARGRQEFYLRGTHNMENTQQWAAEALAKCIDKYTWVAPLHRDEIPYTTDANGRYDALLQKHVRNGDQGLSWWTNGHWGGIMWQMYSLTGNEMFKDVANSCETLLDQTFVDYYGLHHDVGFMWIATAVNNYRLTGNLESRKRALHAANLLVGRLNVAGGFIRAWNDRPGSGQNTIGWAIIDCMMNLPLLYWATAETGDPRYKHAGMMHADTTIKAFIRENGSSNHIVEFDPEVGGVVATYGGQGYAEGTSWTRGQGWALYGFTVNYKMTQKSDYLGTARKVARYFVSQIPASGLIPVDFDQPAEPAIEDSCAAAIAACGLLELALLVDGEEQTLFREAGVRILRALDAQRADYGVVGGDDGGDGGSGSGGDGGSGSDGGDGDGGSGSEAILTHCTGAYHSPESHHIAMVYADYYYIEALNKLANGPVTGFIW